MTGYNNSTGRVNIWLSSLHKSGRRRWFCPWPLDWFAHSRMCDRCSGQHRGEFRADSRRHSRSRPLLGGFPLPPALPLGGSPARGQRMGNRCCRHCRLFQTKWHCRLWLCRRFRLI